MARAADARPRLHAAVRRRSGRPEAAAGRSTARRHPREEPAVLLSLAPAERRVRRRPSRRTVRIGELPAGDAAARRDRDRLRQPDLETGRGNRHGAVPSAGPSCRRPVPSRRSPEARAAARSSGTSDVRMRLPAAVIGVWLLVGISSTALSPALSWLPPSGGRNNRDVGPCDRSDPARTESRRRDRYGLDRRRRSRSNG